MKVDLRPIYIYVKAALIKRRPFISSGVIIFILVASIIGLSYEGKGMKYLPSKPGLDSLINLETPDTRLLEQAIFISINTYRLKNKQPILIWSDTLFKASQYHLSNMITKKFFDHDDPNDSKYPDLSKRVKKYYGNYKTLGENLIQHFPYKFKGKTIEYNIKKVNGKYVYSDPINNKPLQRITYRQFADEVVYNWSISPPHKENMMNGKYRRLGIAVHVPKYNLSPYIVPVTVVTDFSSYQ